MKKSNKSEEFNQEFIIEDKSIKIKIFNYFYQKLISKNHINIAILYFLYIFEIFQLVSYAFSAPHIFTWKLSNKSMQIVQIIANFFRIFPNIVLMPNRMYIIIFIILVILNIASSIIISMNIIFRKENSNVFDRLSRTLDILISPLYL